MVLFGQVRDTQGIYSYEPQFSENKSRKFEGEPIQSSFKRIDEVAVKALNRRENNSTETPKISSFKAFHPVMIVISPKHANGERSLRDNATLSAPPVNFTPYPTPPPQADTENPPRFFDAFGAYFSSVLDPYTPAWMLCLKNEPNLSGSAMCIGGLDEAARNRTIDQAKLIGGFAFLFFLFFLTRGKHQCPNYHFTTCPGALNLSTNVPEKKKKVSTLQEALENNPMLEMALYNASVNPQSSVEEPLIRCFMDSGNSHYVPRGAYNKLAREYNFEKSE